MNDIKAGTMPTQEMFAKAGLPEQAWNEYASGHSGSQNRLSQAMEATEHAGGGVKGKAMAFGGTLLAGTAISSLFSTNADASVALPKNSVMAGTNEQSFLDKTADTLGLTALGTGAMGIVSKTAAKVAPGAGFAFGAVDTANRLEKGDNLGAAMSATIAAASTVPVAGTALSLAGAGIQIATDAMGITGDKSKPSLSVNAELNTKGMQAQLDNVKGGEVSMTAKVDNAQITAQPTLTAQSIQGQQPTIKGLDVSTPPVTIASAQKTDLRAQEGHAAQVLHSIPNHSFATQQVLQTPQMAQMVAQHGIMSQVPTIPAYTTNHHAASAVFAPEQIAQNYGNIARSVQVQESMTTYMSASHKEQMTLSNSIKNFATVMEDFVKLLKGSEV